MRNKLFVTLALLVGCSGPSGNNKFQVRESVEQLHITHGVAGQTLAVLDSSGMQVTTATVDKLGSVMFRHLPAGGYKVQVVGSVPLETTGPLTVKSVDASLPPASYYKQQKLVPGFNYIKTRDGTQLSAYITLPGPPEMGPYPTVVSYSGYDPSRPGEPIGNYSYLCPTLPALCDAPNDPAGLLAALFGYATVNVNMRGTGCSGGAYDFFETLQDLDGYDVIETAAAQSWVLHNTVGMVGLSYPGISQLFVAARRPPSLASIAPMSVIGSANTTILPGGILNDGFAVTWVTQVLNRAAPYGQGWEQKRVDGGDTVCAENQLLHGQLIDNVEQARNTMYYDPAIHDMYNPTTFVDQINVPVFLSGSFQDEQTGPFFITLLDRFTNAPAKRMTVFNGVHPDGFAAQTLVEWYAFLELFVAQRLPVDPTTVRDLSPILFEQINKAKQMRLPAVKWLQYPDYATALAAWKAEPPLRAIFEDGAAKPELGAPQGTFEHAFASWPAPDVTARRWYFDAGKLTDAAPTVATAASTFQLDPAAGQRGILQPGADIWDLLPKYDWQPPVAGKAVVFETDAFAADQVFFGTASVDLWLQSPVDDADLQATLSEVRPDGNEMYIQSGWLRSSLRGLGPDATTLWPSPSYLEKDAKLLVPGEWTQVRVAVAGFGHVVRAGSKIRVIIDTPGGSRAEWRFHNKTYPNDVVYAIGHDATHPSSVALPLIPSMTAPTTLPACPSLRAQPCRTYAAYANTPAP